MLAVPKITKLRPDLVAAAFIPDVSIPSKSEYDGNHSGVHLNHMGFAATDGIIHSTREELIEVNHINQLLEERQEMLKIFHKREKAYAHLHHWRAAAQAGDGTFTEKSVFESTPREGHNICRKMLVRPNINPLCPSSTMGRRQDQKREAKRFLTRRPPCQKDSISSTQRSCIVNGHSLNETTSRKWLTQISPPKVNLPLISRPAEIEPCSVTNVHQSVDNGYIKSEPSTDQLAAVNYSSLNSGNRDISFELMDCQVLRLEEERLKETLHKEIKRYESNLKTASTLKAEATRCKLFKLEKMKAEYARELEHNTALEAILNTLNEKLIKVKDIMEKHKAVKKVGEEYHKLEKLKMEHQKLRMKKKYEEKCNMLTSATIKLEDQAQAKQKAEHVQAKMPDTLKKQQYKQQEVSNGKQISCSAVLPERGMHQHGTHALTPINPTEQDISQAIAVLQQMKKNISSMFPNFEHILKAKLPFTCFSSPPCVANMISQGEKLPKDSVINPVNTRTALVASGMPSSVETQCSDTVEEWPIPTTPSPVVGMMDGIKQTTATSSLTQSLTPLVVRWSNDEAKEWSEAPTPETSEEDLNKRPSRLSDSTVTTISKMYRDKKAVPMTETRATMETDSQTSLEIKFSSMKSSESITSHSNQYNKPPSIECMSSDDLRIDEDRYPRKDHLRLQENSVSRSIDSIQSLSSLYNRPPSIECMSSDNLRIDEGRCPRKELLSVNSTQSLSSLYNRPSSIECMSSDDLRIDEGRCPRKELLSVNSIQSLSSLYNRPSSIECMSSDDLRIDEGRCPRKELLENSVSIHRISNRPSPTECMSSNDPRIDESQCPRKELLSVNSIQSLSSLYNRPSSIECMSSDDLRIDEGRCPRKELLSVNNIQSLSSLYNRPPSIECMSSDDLRIDEGRVPAKQAKEWQGSGQWEGESSNTLDKLDTAPTLDIGHLSTMWSTLQQDDSLRLNDSTGIANTAEPKVIPGLKPEVVSIPEPEATSSSEPKKASSSEPDCRFTSSSCNDEKNEKDSRYISKTSTCVSNTSNSQNDLQEEAIITPHTTPSPPTYPPAARYHTRGLIPCYSSLRQIRENYPTDFTQEFVRPLAIQSLAIIPCQSQRTCLSLRHHMEVAPVEQMKKKLREMRDELITKIEQTSGKSQTELVSSERSSKEHYTAEAEANSVPTLTPNILSNSKIDKESQEHSDVPIENSACNISKTKSKRLLKSDEENDQPLINEHSATRLQEASSTYSIRAKSLVSAVINKSIARYQAEAKSTNGLQTPPTLTPNILSNIKTDEECQEHSDAPIENSACNILTTKSKVLLKSDKVNDQPLIDEHSATRLQEASSTYIIRAKSLVSAVINKSIARYQAEAKSTNGLQTPPTLTPNILSNSKTDEECQEHSDAPIENSACNILTTKSKVLLKSDKENDQPLIDEHSAAHLQKASSTYTIRAKSLVSAVINKSIARYQAEAKSTNGLQTPPTLTPNILSNSKTDEECQEHSDAPIENSACNISRTKSLLKSDKENDQPLIDEHSATRLQEASSTYSIRAKSLVSAVINKSIARYQAEAKSTNGLQTPPTSVPVNSTSYPLPIKDLTTLLKENTFAFTEEINTPQTSSVASTKSSKKALLKEATLLATEETSVPRTESIASTKSSNKASLKETILGATEEVTITESIASIKSFQKGSKASLKEGTPVATEEVSVPKTESTASTKSSRSKASLNKDTLVATEVSDTKIANVASTKYSKRRSKTSLKEASASVATEEVTVTESIASAKSSKKRSKAALKEATFVTTEVIDSKSENVVSAGSIASLRKVTPIATEEVSIPRTESVFSTKSSKKTSVKEAISATTEEVRVYETDSIASSKSSKKRLRASPKEATQVATEEVNVSKTGSIASTKSSKIESKATLKEATSMAIENVNVSKTESITSMESSRKRLEASLKEALPVATKDIRSPKTENVVSRDLESSKKKGSKASLKEATLLATGSEIVFSTKSPKKGSKTSVKEALSATAEEVRVYKTESIASIRSPKKRLKALPKEATPVATEKVNVSKTDSITSTESSKKQLKASLNESIPVVTEDLRSPETENVASTESSKSQSKASLKEETPVTTGEVSVSITKSAASIKSSKRRSKASLKEATPVTTEKVNVSKTGSIASTKSSKMATGEVNVSKTESITSTESSKKQLKTLLNKSIPMVTEDVRSPETENVASTESSKKRSKASLKEETPVATEEVSVSITESVTSTKSSKKGSQALLKEVTTEEVRVPKTESAASTKSIKTGSKASLNNSTSVTTEEAISPRNASTKFFKKRSKELLKGAIPMTNKEVNVSKTESIASTNSSKKGLLKEAILVLTEGTRGPKTENVTSTESLKKASLKKEIPVATKETSAPRTESVASTKTSKKGLKVSPKVLLKNTVTTEIGVPKIKSSCPKKSQPMIANQPISSMIKSPSSPESSSKPPQHVLTTATQQKKQSTTQSVISVESYMQLPQGNKKELILGDAGIIAKFPTGSKKILKSLKSSLKSLLPSRLPAKVSTSRSCSSKIGLPSTIPMGSVFSTHHW